MRNRHKSLQSNRVLYLPVGQIRPNPAQPRRVFEPQALTELADSIREYGILQPLTVRKTAGGYELVAGERPLRAAREANGRLMIYLAEEAKEVHRVFCGIGKRMK